MIKKNKSYLSAENIKTNKSGLNPSVDGCPSVVRSLLFFALLTSQSAFAQTDYTPTLEKNGSNPSVGVLNPSTNCESYVNSANLFGCNLFRELKSNNESNNTIFSPYSICSALSMVAGGACNQTLQEINDVLQFPNEPQTYDIHKTARIIKNSLYNETPYGLNPCEINIANKLFLQDDFNIETNFTNLLADYYCCTVGRVNFDNQEESAKTINDWVSEETRNNITELILPRYIRPTQTKLILTNALYFKGKWSKPFDASKTSEAFFFPNNTKTIDVLNSPVECEMMEQTNYFPYTEDDFVQVVELPYADNIFSMLIILPKGAHSIDDVSTKLTPANLNLLINSLSEKELVVRLPKFKTESSYELNDYLSNMGMATAFTSAADFSGITGDRSLHISQVVHKTFIEVGELGTEASAATAVILTRECFKFPTEIIFNADHPFWFAIKNNINNLILFTGQINNPTA